jgi:tetratricopeptide (TPR) repeat protein
MGPMCVIRSLRAGARSARAWPARGAASLIAVAFALIASGAWAQSPLVAELDTVAFRYHEEPSRLDKIRAGLEEAVKTDSQIANLVALARVSFIWGDIRARTADDKLDAYDRGRQVAKRAVELEPKNVPAHFWFAINSGRWAQTKGVLRSLFLLPTLKEEIQIILDLDPQFTPVYALAGTVYYEVPGVFGGDLNLAEEMFRKGLAQDPKFAAMRVGLGKTLIKKGRIAEARRELQAVLDEKAPSNLADWTLRDSKEARALLESIKGKT